MIGGLGDTLFGDAGNDTFVVSDGAVIIDNEGENTIIAQLDPSADTWLTALANGDVMIVNTAGQSITLTLATLHAAAALDLGGGGTYDSSTAAIAALYRPRILGNPETDPNFNAVRLGAGVRAADIGLLAFNQDLVLTYSGTQPSWINIADLRSRGALVTVADGAAYGLAPGTQALVLHNWYESQRYSYLGVFRDNAGTLTSFAAQAVDLPRHYSGTELSEILSGTAANDFINAGDGDDVVSAMEGADELSGGLGDDSLFGGSGDDTYIYAVGDGQDVIYEESGSRDVLRFAAGIAPADVLVLQEGEDLILQVGDIAADDSIRIVGWHAAEGRNIERIEFADGTVWSPLDVDAQLPGNHRPRLALPIADQLAPPDESFSFTIPSGAFADPNPGDQLTYSASLADGSALPAWLTFDPATLTFSGTPSDAHGGISRIAITVTDQAGLSTTTEVNVRVPVPVELIGTNGDDTLTAATPDIHSIHGLDGDDILRGSNGEDVLEGGSGSDRLVGGGGSDTYVFEAADFDQPNMDVILGERDSAAESIDVIRFGAGIRPEDVRVSAVHDSAGVDLVLSLSTQASRYFQEITVRNGFSTQFGHEILDQVRFADGTIWDREYLYQVAVLGSERDDWITGFDRDDVIRGYGGVDELNGGGGNDDIAGGAGHDLINGQAGDDTYRFGRGQGVDQITDVSGTNRIVLDAGITPADVTLYRTSSRTSIASPWSASTSDSVVVMLDGGQEQLWLMNFFGGATRPISEIVFADGTIWTSSDIDAHLIDVRGVSNVATGTTGNDEYTVDHPSDGVVNETMAGGLDTLHSSVSYQLGNYFIENLTLTGILDINGIGNENQNTIVGNAGDNFLSGSYLSADAAADTLIGGAGDDVYRVDWHGSLTDNFNDIVIEAAGEGYDTIIAHSYVAIMPAHVESLVLKDNRNYFYYVEYRSVTGNDLDNVIDASSATNFGEGFLIDGGLGADVMIGAYSAAQGAPVRDVRFVVDNVGDVVVGNSDADVVQSSVSYVLAEGLEHLELTGSGAINGTGNSGNNRLEGASNSAANVLTGGQGNDTYRLGAGDSLVELAGEGRDTVILTVAVGSGSIINLASFANVENLTIESNLLAATLIGTDEANDLIGNFWSNSLVGGGGNDLLDGGWGSDSMTGGTGNDTYIVDAAGDVVTELTDEGTDRVSSSISYTLGSALEDLTLTGDALDGTGNALANVIVGNAQVNTLTGLAGNDVLDGRGGADILIGGTGDDIYFVSETTETVIEDAGGGIDLVQSQASFALGDHVENLTLLGYASHGTGNALANVIVGNDSSNRLDGGAGADTLSGGRGHDTYVVDHALDVVIEAADQGIDTVQASVSFVLSAGLENLTLVGGADINGTGNDADNVIIGNTGANTLAGGVGNDTYVIDRSDDLVVEAENAGTDTVQSYVSYTLGATLENLTLLGTAELSATGNAGNNLLIGNSANNLLAGGAGDDTYEVQNTGDVIVEDAGEGNDTVRSSATYALSEHIESLLLTGTESIDGTGNALGNLIVGNDGANLLDGGAGNDRLIGGEGNDTYVIDSVLDVIVELSGEGTDTVRSSVSYTLDSALEHLVLSGSDDLQGTGNTRNNQITGNSGNNVIDGGASSDQMAGADGDDLYLVDSTGDAIVEAEGEGVDSVRSSVSYTLSANVENLTLVGFAAATAIGNALDNVLIGNDSDNQLRGDAGNDVLDGGGGRDTFAGGLGDDIYIVNLTTETITEAVDEGIDLVQSSATFTLSENIENLVLTGSGAINGTGNALENLITGNAANNVLNGGAGNDVMRGGAGNDTYVVESTADVVVENTDEGVDTVQSSITYGLTDTVENLMLTGTANIDAIGNALDNVLTGNTGVNVLSGGAGNDLYRVNNATDAVVEHFGEGIDTVEASVNYTLADNVENLTLTGSGSLSGTGNALNNMLLGNSGANILTGGEGNDVLNGGGGSDQMYGGQGDDLYIVAQTNDTVNELVGQGVDTVESSVTYTLANHVENLTLTGSNAINGTGNSGANTLTGNSAANTLNGSAGADVMIGGGGNDTFIVDDVNDLVVELVEEGTDTVQSAVTYALADHVENLTLTGSAAAHGTGNALNNVLIGNSGINNLYGGDGADSLNGGAGADVLVGGSGDDTYFVDNVGDAVTENVDQGVDTVQSTVSHRLSSNVENLILASSSSINGTGNELNNSITGNNGANVLDGGAGADVLSGGGGNDTYIVDHADDLVVEAASAGTDTVRSSVSFVLAANVEHVILTGSADIDGTGNDLANTLTGNSGANLLAGRGGNDTYIITDTMDVVVEEVDDGIDVVQSSVSFTLGSNVETLTLTGSAAVDGTGNELANVLTGNSAANVLVGGAGNDTLNGGAGADSMSGGLGDDVYVLDNAGDAVTEGVDEGLDTVQSSVTHALAQNVENLTLTGSSSINATGNAAANTLIGNNGANVLDGRAGADSMVGGMGNDTYILDDVGDIVVENAAAGIDTVQVSFSYVLGADIENLMLTGTADIDATGNELANVLTGNSGINTLIGGAGDDTYVIQNAGDLVIELAEAGTDTVQSSLSYSLGNNVENLTLTGAGALNGTGNELDNHLVGNSGANTLIGGAGDDVLDGGTGTDQLIGSSGNDIYVVNTASDVVTEIADEGIDLVQASASYTLGSNVENLTLIGSSSISATGNELSNTLTGNNGANTLNGGAGADTMFGAGGNDTYVVDDAGDVVVESTNGGTDTVQAWLTYALGDNIENLTLMGNANLDATGNDLGNVLTGNGGINVLSGGLGNDTYAIDNLVDTIIEHEDAGIDLIQATISYSLGEHVENLTLMGSSSLSATGNGLDNVLTGNSGANVLLGALGNDTLNGAGGADSMQGGMGDDTYIVDNAADQVIEGAEEGIDLVQSSIAYTLGSHLENLTLTGSRAISGTGNDLDNTLIGNSGANELTGGAGDDVLNGGSGADAMTGGTGNDSYTVDNANDTIIELADEGIDSMTSSLARTLAENIEILFLSGSSHIAGNGNDLANLLRGNSGNNMLTGLGGADILEGAAGNDILVGGEGNTLFNGGSGTDTLTGGLGNELFIGGAGNDTITTDGGADIILFNKGDGQDTIAASTTRDNTISIGGGALYADLLFTKNGDDLVLRIGATDQITLAGYYASESNRSVGTLQMIIEGTSDYDAGSADPTRNGRIESFDFDGLVAAFDAARTADPSLTSWSLTNALLAQHLSGSDSEAMGGDFAYRYGVVGSLADISFTPALAILQNPGFGTTAQSLHAIEALQDSTPRLIA
ncbi:calcium-binding protein [Steroidobacter gossypii]|nr:calcium-binding protein [Steroidobacter gossypii]